MRYFIKKFMDKILLAMNAQSLNRNAIEFGCYLARLTKSRLTGIFLEDIGAEALVPGGTAGAHPRGEEAEDNIRLFRDGCCSREVSALVHRDRGVPGRELIEESRYADLIILDPETSFSGHCETPPTRYVREVLTKSECPVILSPYNFDTINSILFSYDGSSSSLFAIRQFSYLFPELKSCKITVLQVREDKGSAVKEQFKLKEWLKNHFAEHEFVVMEGDPDDSLFGYLLNKENCIVVMGAYGRNMLSRFFRPSHARLVIRTVNLPLFIAH
jgi:hypothetical protein